MEFYNLKTRSRVEIPESDITKHKMVRATKTGEQTRYAVKATYEGTPLTKFVSQETYDSLKDVKEAAPAAKDAEKKTADKKPVEKKASEKKTSEKAASEKKPAEKKKK